MFYLEHIGSLLVIIKHHTHMVACVWRFEPAEDSLATLMLHQLFNIAQFDRAILAPLWCFPACFGNTNLSVAQSRASNGSVVFPFAKNAVSHPFRPLLLPYLCTKRWKR